MVTLKNSNIMEMNKKENKLKTCSTCKKQRNENAQFCIECKSELGTQLTGRQESNSLDTSMIFGPEEEIQKPLNAVSVKDEVFQTFLHGSYVQQKPNFCFNCGKELQYNAVPDIKFCPECGVSQIQTFSPVQSTTFQDIQARSISLTGVLQAPRRSPSERGTPYERKFSNQQGHCLTNSRRSNFTEQIINLGTSEKEGNSLSGGVQIPCNIKSIKHQNLPQDQLDTSLSSCSFGTSETNMLPDTNELFECYKSSKIQKTPVIDDDSYSIGEDFKNFDSSLNHYFPQLPINSIDLDDIDQQLIFNSDTTQPRYSINKPSPVETDEYGDTKLHSFIQEDRTEEAIKEMYELQNKFDDETFKKYLNKRNDRGTVPLHSAVRNPRIMENLLQNGADITLLDHHGNNLLHQLVFTFSSEENVLHLFRVVFRHQAMYENEINALLNDSQKAFNSDGFTVVHELTKQCFGNVLEFVKDKGADLNIRSLKEKQTALVIAAKERNWSIVQKLCTLGACVNIPTASEWYAVHAAIEDRDKERLEFFMKKGVDIYGYKQIPSTDEIYRLCSSYMRRRRRKTATSDRGTKKRRRCKCGNEHP